jgi:hypothetical protein
MSLVVLLAFDITHPYNFHKNVYRLVNSKSVVIIKTNFTIYWQRTPFQISRNPSNNYYYNHDANEIHNKIVYFLQDLVWEFLW